MKKIMLAESVCIDFSVGFKLTLGLFIVMVCCCFVADENR